jgi:hypothetical protein
VAGRCLMYERKAWVTGEITPGCMESVESESWADYLLAGREVLGTRALRAGGGVALEVPGPSNSLSRTMGIGWAEPVNAGLLERIIGFYRAARAPSTILMIAPQVLPPDWAALRSRFGIADTESAIGKLSGEARARGRPEQGRPPPGPRIASRAGPRQPGRRMGPGDAAGIHA